ncbi:hypothetical protein F3Y22_tig00111582pilonHSYRG01375 [Hibiscus syriacus]|uniref:Uncharacterized protein n=1 Tax=Hibiscus syriacus TaxID=106335 RepID=A0A6A2YH40_HIBSY|nr:hypothetical protein F3Y22_tig00111582pilonHSYRG01375 [Hibiscus syriacus]
MVVSKYWQVVGKMALFVSGPFALAENVANKLYTIWASETCFINASCRYKPSLLVTMSKDSKFGIRLHHQLFVLLVVGMTSVPGAPVAMKCNEALLYVAVGSSVVVVDLRTMQKVYTVAVYKPKLYSFAIMPSKSVICTGGLGK